MPPLPRSMDATSPTSLGKDDEAMDTAQVLSPSSSNISNKTKSKHWWRPRRWMKHQRASYPPEESYPFNLQKELEELATAVDNSGVNIPLLSLAEIQITPSSTKRICNVENLALAFDDNDEARQQLSLAQNNHKYSLKRVPSLAVSKDGSPSVPSAKIRNKSLKLLVHEAAILTKLAGRSQNVLSLRGLPSNGCPYHKFFLLTDRLHRYTLEDRIHQWRQHQQLPQTTWDAYLEIYGADDDTEATPNDEYVPRKSNYAWQIAKALQACHDAGIVVRDLSPQSIGFAAEDPHCVQLFDLGQALDTTSTLEGKPSLVGKRRYLAGDVWKTGEYSYKTDVYSWAMVFYEMVMERKPFQGYTAAEHQKYVWEKGERPLVSSYLPEGIAEVMQEAWAHRPSERLTTEQVCHKMQALIMNFDSDLFWEQTDGEFLFEVYVPADFEDDTISELGDDFGSVDLVAEVEAIFEDSNAHLVILDESVSKPSKPSRDSSFTTTLSGRQRPHKMVSSAA